jgi:riboflavin kinase/FMN adenylyltransferase
MRVVRTFEELAAQAREVCLAIGVFDGVHLGHQRVISRAREDARAAGGSAVALTFDPHPMRVLAPERAPPLLTSTPHKLRLIEALGVDACLVLSFDKPFSLTPPAKFIEQVARDTRRLREICVGTRFRFGHNRAGDVRLIEDLAPVYGYIAREIEPVSLGGEIISSTAIRQRVLAGQLQEAAAMLGRPFSVLGTVEKGDRLGRQLGFPTANLNPHNEALPPNGVYAARARLGEQRLDGVVNIGLRPTLRAGAAQPLLEIHLFDFDGDIYGRDIEVVFAGKLRDEHSFPDVAALRAQIAADAQAARALLRSERGATGEDQGRRPNFFSSSA